MQFFSITKEKQEESGEEKIENVGGLIEQTGGKSTSTLDNLLPKRFAEKEWQEKIDKISIEDINITQNGKNIIDTKTR